MSANSTQIGGDHYSTNKDAAVGVCPNCRGPIQHWDWAQSLKGLEYAATKYLGRWWMKDGLKSLQKVLHYTQKLIETHYPSVKVKIEFTEEAPLAYGSIRKLDPNCMLKHPHDGSCIVHLEDLDADALRDGIVKGKAEELCGICTHPISQCDCSHTGRR